MFVCKVCRLLGCQCIECRAREEYERGLAEGQHLAEDALARAHGEGQEQGLARGAQEGREAEWAEIAAMLEAKLATSVAASAWEEALDEIRCLIIARGEPTPKSALTELAARGYERLNRPQTETPICPHCGERRRCAIPVDEPKSQLLGIATPGREGSVSGATPVEYVSGEVRIPMLATSAEDEAIVGGLVSEKTGAGRPMSVRLEQEVADRHSNMLAGASALGALRVAFVEYLAWQDGTGDWDTFMSWIADERP